MDYRKAYNAALETARQWIKDGCTDKEKIALECTFPELRESEDEKIRQEIIDYLHLAEKGVDDYARPMIDRWIAYLENQKDTNCLACDQHLKGYLAGRKATEEEKQKEIPMPDSTQLIEWWDEEEAMLKEKDFRDDTWRIAQNAFMDGVFYGWRIKQQEPETTSASTMIPSCWEEKQKEQKPVDTTEIAHCINCPVYEKAEWSEEDQKMLRDVYESLYAYQCDLRGDENPDTELLDQVKKEKQWIKSLPEKLKPQPKQEWTDEDEKMLDKFINRLETVSLYTRTDSTSLNFSFFNEIGWLKSLRNRYAFKPSKEQIYSLGTIVNVGDNTNNGSVGYHLKSLYEQLKKLKEED